MQQRCFAGLVVALVALLGMGCRSKKPEATPAPTHGADTIYRGGPIVTVNDRQPRAEAVAVTDGKIVAVGADEEVMALRDDDTEVIDLEGHTLVPGFVDGHAHFFGFGAQAIGANLLAPPDGRVTTIDALVDELKTFAAGPDVERTGWIFGLGYDDAVLEEGRHPTRDDLDRVSTEVPVMAVHISGHFAAVNSVGLEKIGYTSKSKDPEGGVIRRRPNSKEPNGVIEELAAIPVMLTVVTPKTPENQTYFLSRAQDLATKFGYTTAQEGRAFGPNHDALSKFAKDGNLEIDVVSYIDYSARDLLDTDWHGPDYTDRYRIGGMKITLDGSPQGRTAWRTIPYTLPPEGQPKDYAGYPAIPNDADVASLYDLAFANGWQVLTHANGDAAVDQLIRTMRPAIEKYGNKDRRPVLIHGQLIRLDQLDALAEMGVMPSLFPMHTFYWGDWYGKIIGPEMAQKISPTRSALDRGMLITSHTDAPVALPNLVNVMDTTVNRRSRSGKVIGPDERLTPLEALKSVTLWGAYQHFEENRKGSIEVGKLADFVVLSENPLDIEPTRIGEIQVLQTVKEGNTVFRVEGSDDPVKPNAQDGFTLELVCAGQNVDLDLLEDSPRARIDGKTHTFVPVKAASGARYDASGLQLWNKGQAWSFSRDGETFRACESR
ncbi:MAG: amidohydrolase [Myxococcota bacterium]